MTKIEDNKSLRTVLSYCKWGSNTPTYRLHKLHQVIILGTIPHACVREAYLRWYNSKEYSLNNWSLPQTINVKGNTVDGSIYVLQQLASEIKKEGLSDEFRDVLRDIKYFCRDLQREADRRKNHISVSVQDLIRKGVLTNKGSFWYFMGDYIGTSTSPSPNHLLSAYFKNLGEYLYAVH